MDSIPLESCIGVSKYAYSLNKSVDTIKIPNVFYIFHYLFIFMVIFYETSYQLTKGIRESFEKKYYCMNGFINCIDGSFSLFF